MLLHVVGWTLVFPPSVILTRFRCILLGWSRQVTNEQLVYLQNLILVSNDAVTNAFGAYEEDQDPVRLAESLKQVCVRLRAL